MEIRRLGDILVEAGLIDGDHLRRALAVQNGTSMRLGEVLLELGFVSEQLMVKVLEFQLGIPRVSLRECRIPSRLTDILPRSLAENRLVFPLELKEGRIMVAMADPLDYLAIEAIQRSTGLSVEVCLATRSEVREAIERCYPVPEKSEPGS